MQNLGITKAIVVFDEGVRKAGLADSVLQSLKDEDIDYIVYPEVCPDPTDVSMEKGADIARKSGNINGVIGIGGGSSLDTAKGINVLLGNPSPLSDYYLGGKPTAPGFPLILIPTTSGSGSETTRSCIVTDTVNHRKATIRSSNCNLASLAIVDPELTAGMPKSLTVITGIDALSHALESYTVKHPNHISDTLDMEAIRRIVKYLPRAVANGSDMEAREQVGIAATMSGMAFANSLCHLGHSFGHAIGATVHIPHGVCVGGAMAQVINFSAQVWPERVRTIGECMGVNIPEGTSPDIIGKTVGEALLRFRQSVGLPSIKDFNVKREDVISAYPLVTKDGCYPFAPKEMSEEQIKEYLGKMYDSVL